MRLLRYFILFAIVVLAMSSCKIYKKVELPNKEELTGYHKTNEPDAYYDTEKHLIRNSSDLKWGLAMSGGGIRSATYNMGALKAIYDSRLLDSIQIISSVSGGGYLSYGVYSNYYLNRGSGKKFGYYTFDNEYFLKNVTEKQSKANFIPLGNSLLALFSSPNGAFRKYSRRIRRLYSNGVSKELSIDCLNESFKKGAAPYFILNATLATKKNEPWLGSNFELTPAFMGNPEIGCQDWNIDYSFNWNKAITISAANLRFKLLQNIPNFSSKIDADYLGLSDGGHSENLGAIALIRRGVKNIIIVDATHNIDYSFTSYKKLKSNIKQELNLDLKIDGIDYFIENNEENLKQSVYKGTIQNIPSNSNDAKPSSTINVYYIKMSMSDDINNLLAPMDIENNGYEMNKVLIEQSCIEYNRKNICKEFDHAKLDNYSSMNLRDLSIYWVKSYSNHLNNHSLYKSIGYKFPHTTTKDQTFYRDQMAAFIGLGYLQATELIALIGQQN